MATFNRENKAVVDDVLLGCAEVRLGKMFGFPAYYVGKKLCICVYEQGVGVKLPAQSVIMLLATDHNIVPFQPMGKPKMREWIQVNLSCAEDFRHYMPVFDESIRYVLAQQTQGEV